MTHVYYEITDPMPGDDVPIRLNNKGILCLVRADLQLYMLPKYNELDLTPFAPFWLIAYWQGNSVSEVDYFADTGLGCFNFLLRFCGEFYSSERISMIWTGLLFSV